MFCGPGGQTKPPGSLVVGMTWKFDTPEYAALAEKAEMFETPEWAVGAILDREILTHMVVDPCVGRGVMADAAVAHGYKVHAMDLFEWQFEPNYKRRISYAIEFDFFNFRAADVLPPKPWTCFMNPPFSLATEFVEHALDQGARKIVMFQRWAFFESKRRAPFWERHPPTRVYLCASRATCWRVDIPPEVRKEKSNTPTAHGWFVWEPGHPGGPNIGRLEK